MKPLIARESIDANLRFLIVEVRQQVERTEEYFREPSAELLEQIVSRDDYIDNLKGVIQRKVIGLAQDVANEAKGAVFVLTGIEVVTVNLERIADFCGNVLEQLGHLKSLRVLEVIDFQPFFAAVSRGLSRVSDAVFELDIGKAIEICRTEPELDQLYASAFSEVLSKMTAGDHPQSMVTLIFIAHYFERMGDSLLNIGEAIISACLGEPIKIGQFEALESSLRNADIDERVSDIDYRAITGTRSGHLVARVDRNSDPGEDEKFDSVPPSPSHRRKHHAVIFKEGRSSKLVEERDAVALWHELAPGLTPKIYSFEDRGDSSAILFEYIPGPTFERIVLAGDLSAVRRAIAEICETLQSVWTATTREGTAAPRFVRQLARRLNDVYAAHPEFQDSGGRIEGAELPAFGDLLQRVAKLDETLAAPFSVLIHGDLNVDNIIFEEGRNRVRFIDVHRSRFGDYAQDVSVFLVSNLRLRVLSAQVRRCIRESVLRFWRWSAEFAQARGDDTFSSRLALGLARSFATSARFVLDEEFAKTLLLKSHYLLEKSLSASQDARPVTIPEELLLD